MREPASELEALRGAGLLRHLRPLHSPQGPLLRHDGREIINFSSNDYLGLANADLVKAALVKGVEEFGAGAGASRLVCGSLPPHAQLEAALAAFKRTEAALTFSSGYAAAVGTLTALLGQGDVVILDKLSHASLVDGAKLSGATLRVFPHNDMEKLARLLAWAKATVGPDGRILVVTESVFSMDGDWADLWEIVKLKDAAGALLLLDEAHGLGVLGQGGRGLANKLGLEAKIDLHLGTLSKAVGLSGGYLCARQEIIDLLVNKARSFIYSTAPPPAVAFAAKEVLAKILPTSIGDRRRTDLWRNIEAFAAELPRIVPEPQSGIVPIIVGDSAKAMALSAALLERGFLVPAIRFPTVARNAARLRITFSASHTETQVKALAAAIRTLEP